MTNSQLANKLRDLSAHMDCVAIDMLTIRRGAVIAGRGRELLSMSGIALTWVRHLEETADDNRDPGDEAS